MKKGLFISVAIFFILNCMGWAQGDKDKLFEKIKSQYSNLIAISLNFTLNDNTAVKGELIAKKGNKYVLSIANRKIYCDGKTIWNYVPENKNVLVSSFENHGESASIEKIFFEFTNNFKPVKLYKNQTARGKFATTLELIPDEQTMDDITMIKLDVNPDNNEILQINIIRNYSEESWQISNVKINPVVADNKFKFEPSENVEIIDLR